MKKILFAFSASLLMGAGVFYSVPDKIQTADLAKCNIEASSVSAVQRKCEQEYDFSCDDGQGGTKGILYQWD